MFVHGSLSVSLFVSVFVFGFVCVLNDDNQKHLMECVIIKCFSKTVFHNEQSKYEDVFGDNVKKTFEIVKIIEDAVKCRELLLEK